MKLLKEFSNQKDAEQLASALRDKGILIHVSFFSAPKDQAKTVSTWVVADDQVADAFALLDNPEHIVSHPVSPKDMALLAPDKPKPQANRLSTWIQLTAKRLSKLLS